MKPAGGAVSRGAREDTAYFYGIRGITALIIMTFHCDVMIHYLPHRIAAPLYEALTGWLRYGDFRVVPFFVISGYLLTLPAVRGADWPLRRGLAGFFTRRFTRVVYPYYFALALSLVFFTAWRQFVGMPVHLAPLAAGTLAHLLLIHNLHPKSALYINDTLWTVALEFQCYVLMALLFFPIMRRTGPWAPAVLLAVAAAIGFGQRAFFGDRLDTTRPWFLVIFALGMAAAALENRAFPAFARVERAVPWGTVWLVAFVAGVALTVAEGPDPAYWRCWPSVMCFGVSFTAFVVYLRGPRAGLAARAAVPLVALLEVPLFAFVGRFSYSIYLTHFPVYRLLLAVVARRTDSLWIEGALGYFLFTPICLALAYGFHVAFERPFQTARPETAPVAVPA